MIRVGLIGARGYVGRELIAALDRDDRFDLAFASSRAMAGKALSATPGLATLHRFGTHVAEELGPDEAAARPVDVLVLGLPNGLAAPYVAAVERSSLHPIIIDLSADYRHQDGWIYGAPEMFSDTLKTAKRIANPGCYVTAANLGLLPITDLVAGPVSVFGVSGFSGAGTTPSSRNDAERLEANVIPYGFGGHGHQKEIAVATKLNIVFAPHVASFFRGLIVTITAPLRKAMTPAAIKQRYLDRYADAAQVEIIDEAPEITRVAGQDKVVIGGFSVDQETRMLTLTSGLDNLRKGAATQAMENIVLATGV
ncbi:MAG: N-acetyl-gamma-glutamyl-phosphate reductase [Pseudomonadota bacterium]